ncbi:MAG TPA: sodium-dependent transporter [Thermoanaerobaculia bacterium]|nr:sodium-dependent transporter [Thermoanaerobaculia bacterium]
MSAPNQADLPRETYTSRLSLVLTMLGVAVGLGNVWRFPYMVGRFGGAAFVLVYVLAAVLLGIPALMAEWALGRHTRRGPVGAFERAGFPLGRAVGWFLFFVMFAATGYYINALGWVLYYGVGEAAGLVGAPWAEGAILPPTTGFVLRSFLLQMGFTAVLITGCAAVLLRGLRAGIERTSKVLIPLLFFSLLVLMIRALTLPGAGAGVTWFIGKFELTAFTPRVVAAAFGQVFFTLSLGGTMMVVYGSYLAPEDRLAGNATITTAGDTLSGLLAGFAILPAVVSLGLLSASEPDLIFVVLPRVFATIPLGRLFGLLFFLGLLGSGFLSAIAAYEVQVAALTDNTRLSRKQAVWWLALLIFLIALPPMPNLKIFLAWDLTFGSGMQTLGSLFAVIAVCWCLKRATVLRELGGPTPGLPIRLLYLWLRFAVPVLILFVGIWWLVSEVLGKAGGG